MRLSLALLVLLAAPLAARPAAAYSIGAESIGAGGFVYSTPAMEASVEVGRAISDTSNDLIDGHAATNGETGSMSGYMLVSILDYFAAQSTNVTTFLLEKSWKSVVSEEIDGFVLDPGATELVLRLHVGATDESDLAIAPSAGFDNGFARSHVRAQLRYYNLHSHTQGLDQILGVATSDRNLPFDWTPFSVSDVSPIGYGSASQGDAYAEVELRVPASEVDGDDYLLVSGQLYGEVRGGHWNGAFAKSQLTGSMSFETIGGQGVPQNPAFLAPEPAGALLGEVATAGVGLLALVRRQPKRAR